MLPKNDRNTVIWQNGISKSLYKKSSSIDGSLPSMVVFNRRSSSIKSRLPLEVLFHQRVPPIKGRLLSKVVFYQGCLPQKVVFHQRFPSNRGHPPSEIIFHRIECVLEYYRMFPYHPPFSKPLHKLILPDGRTE